MPKSSAQSDPKRSTAFRRIIGWTDSTSGMLCAICIVAALILLVDIALPLGFAGGVPYVAVVLIALAARPSRMIIWAAILGSVLTVLGFSLSPHPAGTTMWVVLLNRAVALFAIWTTAIVAFSWKRAQESLRRAERMASLATLATGLAHEMKNPIAALLTSSHVAMQLKDEHDCSSQLDKVLTNVINCAERCNAIVDKLRAFAGGQLANKQPSSLNEVVRRAAESTHDFCEYNRACIDLALEPDLPPVNMNEEQLEMMLANLIQNAAQAAADDVKIVVRTTCSDGKACVEVQDNGCGIGDEEKRHAFDPFYSAHRNQGRMGLGLSIAHGIVTDHSGSIQIDGAVGKGTTVTVELPLASTLEE